MRTFHASTVLTLAAAMVAGAAISSGARAAGPIELKFADPGRPGDWVYKGMEHLAKAIEQGSGGAVEIRIFAGGSIANFRNVYDRLLNGVADGAFGTFGGLEDEYPKTSVSGLPFTADLSSEAGLAMWRLYSSGVTADEFTKMKPLAMFGFGVSGLHFTQPIHHLGDLKGLKILVNGRSAGNIVAALGATPISSTPGELYQGLSRGLAQGIEFTYTGLVAFKLYPLTKYHLNVPFGTTGGYFAMNNNSYARLPEKVQNAIDQAAGEPATRDMGKRADDEDARTKALVVKEKGNKVIKLSAAELSEMKKMISVYTEEWIKSVPDGAAVLAAYRAEIAKIKKGM